MRSGTAIPTGEGNLITIWESSIVILGVVSIWILLFCLFTAIGNCTLKGIHKLTGTPQPLPTLFFSFWSGLAVTLALAQVISLFSPLNSLILYAFLLAGIFAWLASPPIIHAPPFKSILKNPWTLGLGSAALGLVVLTAYGSTAPEISNGYDTLLYHWSALRWINNYPAVPGLANLHIRLGTPSAWLVFAGLLDNGPLDRRTAWILCGFPLAVTQCQWLYFLHPRINKDRNIRFFLILSLPFLMFKAANMSPSLFYDLPAHVLLMVCMLEVLRIHAQFSSWDALTSEDFTRLLIPAALSFAIKPIGTPIFVLVLLAWLLHAFRRIQKKTPLIPILWPFTIPALLGFGWLARNAIITGWLLFPMPIGALPVDWRVPEYPSSTDLHMQSIQSVRGQVDIIKGWARDKGDDTYEAAIHAPHKEWVPKWIKRYEHRMEVGRLLPLAGILASVLVLMMIYQRSQWRFDTFLLLGIFFQLGFWFWSAPDIRFGDGLIWMSLAVISSRIFNRIAGVITSAVPAICLSLWLCSLSIPQLTQLRYTASPRKIGQSYALPVSPVKIENGQVPELMVWEPLEKDQTGDAPLPNTPYIQHNLYLREAGNLREGFYLGNPRL